MANGNVQWPWRGKSTCNCRFRNVRSGRPAHGRGWIGLVSREAYVVQGVEIRQFLPAWAYLILAALGLLIGWLREGRWDK